MRLLLTISIIIAFVQEGYSCKCTYRDLKTDLQLSEKILVGELIDINESRQEIKILKVWKGEIKTETLTIPTEGNDGCHRRILFPTNEYFIIFLEADGIHNCSRTTEYLKSTDVKVLDSIFSKTLWVKETERATLERLEYSRQFIIHTDKWKVDIKDKKVVFNFEGKVKSRENLPPNLNDFYPVRCFLVATKDSIKNNPCGIDYIFYVNQVHQDMILLETRRQQIEKKSLRSACR
jgi:hypothetical protein